MNRPHHRYFKENCCREAKWFPYILELAIDIFAKCGRILANIAKDNAKTK